MITTRTLGAPAPELSPAEVSDLQLAPDDLDVVAGMLPEHGPQGVSCGGNYCPAGWCQSNYSSK